MKNLRYKLFYLVGYYQPTRPKCLYNLIDWIRYELLWDGTDERHYY